MVRIDGHARLSATQFDALLSAHWTLPRRPVGTMTGRPGAEAGYLGVPELDEEGGCCVTEPSTSHRGGTLASDLGVLHRYLLVGGALVIVVMTVGLAFGASGITRIRPTWPEIYPYTLAGAGALVIATTLLDRGGRTGAVLGRVLAGITIVAAGTVDLAVGAGLLPSSDPVSATGATLVTALPSLASMSLAASVLLLGIGRDRTARIRFWLAVFAGLVSLLSLMSYVYGSASLFGSLGLGGTSIGAGLIGILLAGSLMAARPDQPPLAGLDERYDRALVRRVLPPLVVVPFAPALISWGMSKVEPDDASATAVAQVVTVVLLLVIVAVAGGGQSRARHELDTERQRLWEAFAHTPAPTAVVSLEAEVQMANAALARLLDRTETGLVGMRVVDLVAEQDRADVTAGLADVVAGGDDLRLDVQLVRGRTSTVWVDFGAAPVRDVSGLATYVILQCNDLTDRKRLETVLADLATRDPLTGLLNREGLSQRLRELRTSRTPGQVTAIVYADVDRLKPLNDSVGHSAGDELLREVARRLVASTREEDIVARVGGDEFVVVTRVPAAGPDPAEAVVARLRRELGGTVMIGRTPAELSVSLGASILGDDEGDDDTATAVARADRAMYDDKQRRRASDQD